MESKYTAKVLKRRNLLETALALVALACNPRIQQVKAKGSGGVQGHTLHSLNYVRSCLKKEKKKKLSVYQDRVSPFRSECPGTHSANLAGLKLTYLPASASLMLELKACDTTPN